jgi:uncharacterized membrane protein
MPYHWLPPTDGTQRLQLWPYRSLPRRGFVGVIGATALLLGVPLIGLLGSPVLWALLPFLLAVIAAIWWALERSYRDGEIVEELTIAPGLVTLVRHGPRGRRQDWQANPHWVQVTLHPTGGPVPDYLTLKGEGRAVELGAFLTEAERRRLAAEITAALRPLR